MSSTISLSIKQLHGAVDAVEVTTISSAVCWLLTTAWLFLAGETCRSLWAHDLLLLLLRGIMGALAILLYYTSIQMLPMQEAVSIFFMNPAFAVVLNWLVNGKVVNRWTLLGCMLGVTGVVLIAHPTCNFSTEGHGGTHHVLAIALCLGGALAHAGGYICVHKLGPAVPFVVLMWW